jgi:branched-chain amino acid transport system substrate-binding protein
MKTKGSYHGKWVVIGCIFMFFVFLAGLPQAGAFVPLKGDLSKYDPNNQTFPTSGDTIKVAIWDVFSGPDAWIAEAYFALLGFVAQDINSQGGIKVDGKMKKIQIVKADTQAKPDPAKRAMEKAILEDKVNILTGVAGSHLMKAGMAVAKQYKVILLNNAAYTDELMFLPDFNEYTFRTCGTVDGNAKTAAAYYEKRPETKFYILAQDYLFGHAAAKAFKETLKAMKPKAQIVGEEYFPVFSKDFGPYLEKVRASGAEAIFSMAWGADSENMIKQTRQLGLRYPLNKEYFIPIISTFLDATQPLEAIGGPAGRGLVLNTDFQLDPKRRPNDKKFMDIWHGLWKTWKAPYNSVNHEWPNGGWLRNTVSYYWLFQVIQKAGSLDPEKIIKAWEGDTFDAIGQKQWMRPDDHQAIADRALCVLEFPNKWFEKNAGPSDPNWIPAKDCMPGMDPKLVGRVKK